MSAIKKIKLNDKSKTIKKVFFDVELVKEKYRDKELLIFLCEDDKRKYLIDKNDYVVTVVANEYLREGHYVIKKDDMYHIATIQSLLQEKYSVKYSEYHSEILADYEFEFIGLIVTLIKNI